jgi:uncharacterized protein (UPF0332 family)
VLALLQKIGRVPSKHTGVISLFDTEFVMKGVFPKEFSRNLHQAFDLRHSTDYKVTEQVSMQEAKEALDAAAEFTKGIGAYLGSA